MLACSSKDAADTGTAPPSWTGTTATGSTTSPSDRDLDGVPDAEDPCPDDATQWTDADGDGWCDEIDDDCPDDPAGHIDSDGDGYCDGDSDPCPDDPNQWTDADADGWCDEVDDDCPDDPAGHVDSNGDGLCNGQDDDDGDGLSNDEETVLGADCTISDPEVPDTDNDGVLDPEDPFPRDPFTEFILFRNEDGTIDLMLSHRDGTFDPPAQVGDVYGGTGNASYRYTQFAVSDWDGDGQMDFLAIGDPDPEDANNALDLWYFWRSDELIFEQRLLGQVDLSPLGGAVADLDVDGVVDLARILNTTGSNGYIDTATIETYLGTGLVRTATCAVTEDPANPEGCAFVHLQGVDLTTTATGSNWAHNQWGSRLSRQAVDVTGDGVPDMVHMIYANGGDAEVPVGLVVGRGDGTFDPVPAALFFHNDGTCGNSPANSVLFGDFDGDGLGDVMMGLDDDGDPGSLWFYPGMQIAGEYYIDTTGCYEALDINPTVEYGSDSAGVSTSAVAFDFDFNGYPDIALGYNYTTAWAPPSKAIVSLNQGAAGFWPPYDILDFPDSSYASTIAIPNWICPPFPLGN